MFKPPGRKTVSETIIEATLESRLKQKQYNDLISTFMTSATDDNKTQSSCKLLAKAYRQTHLKYHKTDHDVSLHNVFQKIVKNPNFDTFVRVELYSQIPKQVYYQECIDGYNSDTANTEISQVILKYSRHPKVNEIIELGFSIEMAEASLEMKKYDIQQAVNLLFEDPGSVEAFYSRRHHRIPSSPHGSMYSLKSNSLNRSSPSRTPPDSSPVSQRARNAQDQTFQPKPLRKMHSFLGMAMEALGLDDVETHANVKNQIRDLNDDDSKLEESFTIYLGTQVKTMYNLRLVVSEEKVDPDFEFAFRAQMLTSLYNHDLTAKIFLVKVDDICTYGKSSVNKEFFDKCRQSTEYHFDSVDEQLSLIKSSLPKNNEDGKPILKQGDFFTTKHSNGHLFHVAFHLCIGSSDDNTNIPINSQNDLIKGYRAILKMAQVCDINHLIVPIILCENPDNESIIYKRSELVLKSTKGQLMEYNRSLKHSVNSSGTEKNQKSIQFILPQLHGGTTKPDGTNISRTRVIFRAIREKLAEVFRTQ